MPTPVKRITTSMPVVALVGRVNVGKSSLFNKLIEENKAIVSDIAGTTRTRNEGTVLWRGTQFRLIDTGGLTFSSSVVLEDDIIAQTKMALHECDIVVFVTDGDAGLLPQERELAKLLRRAQRPVILVANKVDSKKISSRIDFQDWLGLGFGDPLPLSAANGSGVGNFLDILYQEFEKIHKLPTNAEEEDEEEPYGDEEVEEEETEERKDQLVISIIGKPNAGKSSLFNKLIGEDRVIVSDMAHTTREPYDTDVIYPHIVGDQTVEEKITFIDTAGIRRKAKVSGMLERKGISKSIESIDKSNLVLFVLDGSEPISSQDRQLGGFLERHSKSVIILINKWDLAEDTSDEKRKEVIAMIQGHFPHLAFAPILFVSGKTGLNVHKIFPLITQIWQARHTTIGVKALEAFLREATGRKMPSRGKGTRHPELLGIRQINSNPPVFEVFVKSKTSLHRSYIHYLENRLRDQFDFHGTPVVIHLRKMKKAGV